MEQVEQVAARSSSSIYNAAPVPERVASYRTSFRAEHIGPRYAGWLHFSFTTFGAIAAIVFAASRIHGVAPLEWLTIPIGFLIANAGEYFGHRYPMHRPLGALGVLYQRHTLEHHHFFTEEAMPFESARDFKITLFPPVMLVFFLGCLAAPIAALLHVAISPNVGWLFATTAVTYFLSYEWLHFAYHLNPDSVIGRIPFMGLLRRHHTRHHDLGLMGRYNFNITFPVCDLLFGTYYRPKADPRRPQS